MMHSWAEFKPGQKGKSWAAANYPMQNADLKGDLQKQSSVYPNGLDL